MTYAEFYARIENFPNRFSNRSLASYLSALHALTEARQAGPLPPNPCRSMPHGRLSAPRQPTQNTPLSTMPAPRCVSKPHNCTEWAAGKRKTDAAIPVLFRKLGMRGTTSIPFHYWNAVRAAWRI